MVTIVWSMLADVAYVLTFHSSAKTKCFCKSEGELIWRCNCQTRICLTVQ